MLTQEDDIDAHALRKRGWSISAIARHLGRDRKTIRAYLSGDRTAGVRAPAGDDVVRAVRARTAGNDSRRTRTCGRPRCSTRSPRWATTGPTRGSRITCGSVDCARTCEPCHPATGRAVAIIDHPAGEETQWDWVDLPDPPAGWDGYGRTAHLLVGALSHSGKWRGVLAESTDQPHLVDAQHRVAVGLGGLSRVWRFDRMSTVVHPGTGKVTASYAAVAKHYGVHVMPCPPRRGNRKGVVEKANHTAAQRWWRTLPDDVTVAQAQARLDQFCAERPTQGRGSSTRSGPVAALLFLPPRNSCDRSRPRRSRWWWRCPGQISCTVYRTVPVGDAGAVGAVPQHARLAGIRAGRVLRDGTRAS